MSGLLSTYIVTAGRTLLPVPQIASWDAEYFDGIRVTTSDGHRHVLFHGKNASQHDVKAALADLLALLHKRSLLAEPSDPLYLSIIDSDGKPTVQTSLTF